MDVKAEARASIGGVRAGLALGFAAPALFLGSLPRYKAVPSDNVEAAWREVGRSLKDSIERSEMKRRARRR